VLYALGRRTALGPEALGFHSADLTRYQPYNTLDTLITIICFIFNSVNKLCRCIRSGPNKSLNLNIKQNCGGKRKLLFQKF
jgi:hypothetical protein